MYPKPMLLQMVVHLETFKPQLLRARQAVRKARVQVTGNLAQFRAFPRQLA
jgi:hypothetical protein